MIKYKKIKWTHTLTMSPQSFSNVSDDLLPDENWVVILKRIKKQNYNTYSQLEDGKTYVTGAITNKDNGSR